MRLKIINTVRKSEKELEKSYNPINLDYILEEDDPLSPWLEERESPLLDAHDNTWLNEEDDDNISEAQPSQHRSQGPETSVGGRRGGISKLSPITGSTHTGSGGDDNDDVDDASHSSDDSGPPNTSGETFVPSTYPYDRDVYSIQGNIGASAYDPSPLPPPPPPPMPSGKPEDNYKRYNYGDSSDYTTNYEYEYGYDISSSELSYYNPYPSMTMPLPQFQPQPYPMHPPQPQPFYHHNDDNDQANFVNDLFGPSTTRFIYHEDGSATQFTPNRRSFWH